MTYTILQIADDLNISRETVRYLIITNQLTAVKTSGRGCHGQWAVDEESYRDFLRRKPKYNDRHSAKEKVHEDLLREATNIAEDLKHGRMKIPDPIDFDDVPLKNVEGYSDPTAYTALRNIDSLERFHEMIRSVFDVVNQYGFRVDGRIIFVDKKTGRVYR